MKINRSLYTAAGLAFVIAACSPSLNAPIVDDGSGQSAGELSESIDAPAGVEPSTSAGGGPVAPVESLPAEDPPRGAEREFSTDFSKHTIPYSEILSGGPPKDGIPAIDRPQFVTVAEADAWLQDFEPVTVYEAGDETRIYPIQIMIWHEIVNDVVGGKPVTVTFCPLCNTAIVFDATVNGIRLDFGTTGRLRFSNLLMYDRQTESWWQQATGEAVIGELLGTQLTFLAAPSLAWSEAAASFPDAQVLSRETGFTRNYGSNPYVGYDNINSSPFLFDGPSTPAQLPPMARVTTVDLNGEAVAYPNDVLAAQGVVNDLVGGTEVVIVWQPGLASALDSRALAEGQDVGSNGVFERQVDGRLLTFSLSGENFIDDQTGSTWNILGEAIDGELEGQSLTPVVKVDHFWFSWAAFRPDTRVYQP